MTEVVVAGHVCLDIIPELRSDVVFEPGRLVEAGPATLSTGGAVSNTGISLSKLGVEVRLMGKVSNDLFGRAIQELLGPHGAGLVVAPGEPSSYTVVVNLSGRDRMFLHAPGCNNTFTSADVTAADLQGAKLMHFGYPPIMRRMYLDEGEELVRLFRKAKEAGVVTSLDMSLPDVDAESGRANWRRILERVLPYCDLFLPSIEEMLFMLDRETFDTLHGALMASVPSRVFESLADEALAMGAKVVAIKAGSRGMYLRSGASLPEIAPDSWRNVELYAPCFKVDVVGTTGAGDATIAGLLMGLLRGMTPHEASRAAVAVGACCCERADATSGVQPWDATLRRIEAGWPRQTLRLDSEWKQGPAGAYVRA